jgi:hypothetical protein
MRNRLVLRATLVTMALGLVVAQNAWAQQENRREGGQQGNPTAGQNRNQSATEMETIRGIVAGITTEGEFVFDYRTNRVLAAEGGFLTVVGSPMKWDHGDVANRAKENANANANDRDRMHRMRHNVYMVWLSPRTKVCEANMERGKANQIQNQSQAEKKECALDDLQIGDRVEIKFTRREESSGNAVQHQTEQMRQKHGRHRTFVVNASEITILPDRDEDHSNKKAEGSSTER